MRRFLLSLTILLALCSTGLGAETVPFDTADGLVWVKVTTEKGAALNFLIDSGAGSSIIDTNVARRLGAAFGREEVIRGVGRNGIAHRVAVEGMRLGRIALPEGFLAYDLSGPAQVCSRGIDGLLGVDFLRGKIVQFDFAGNCLRISPRGSQTPAGETLRLTILNGTPSVPVRVNGSAARPVRVDTGFNGDLRWAASVFDHPSRRVKNSIALAVAKPEGQSEVRIGATRLNSVAATLDARTIFPGEAGLLGTGVLSRFARMTLDLDRRRMILETR